MIERQLIVKLLYWYIVDLIDGADYGVPNDYAKFEEINHQLHVNKLSHCLDLKHLTVTDWYSQLGNTVYTSHLCVTST